MRAEFTKDEDIRDDLIIGRQPILSILKLSHWKYMERYLKTPDCPIKLIGPRLWVTRRSLLNQWLNDILTGKIEIAQMTPAVEPGSGVSCEL